MLGAILAHVACNELGTGLEDGSLAKGLRLLLLVLHWLGSLPLWFAWRIASVERVSTNLLLLSNLIPIAVGIHRCLLIDLL